MKKKFDFKLLFAFLLIFACLFVSGGCGGGGSDNNRLIEDIQTAEKIIDDAWETAFIQDGVRQSKVNLDNFIETYITLLENNQEVVSAQFLQDRGSITVEFASGYKTEVLFRDKNSSDFNSPTAFCGSAVETIYSDEKLNPSAAVSQLSNMVENVFIETLQSSGNTGAFMDDLRNELDTYDFIVLTAHGWTTDNGVTLPFSTLANQKRNKTPYKQETFISIRQTKMLYGNFSLKSI